MTESKGRSAPAHCSSGCPGVLLGLWKRVLCQWLYWKDQEDSECGPHRGVAVREGCYLVRVKSVWGLLVVASCSSQKLEPFNQNFSKFSQGQDQMNVNCFLIKSPSIFLPYEERGKE